MKKIFIIFILLITILIFSKPTNSLYLINKQINKDSLPWKWKGKPITEKELDDSLRVLILKIHDSIENTKNKKIKLF